MPPDIANGLVLSIAKNLPPETPQTKLPMIVATPKPRLVTLVMTPGAEERFSIAGSVRKATRFDIKIEFGGMTGIVARVTGKEPPDVHIWIMEGEAPAFVKEEGIRYAGGPVTLIELASPVWPRSPEPPKSK